jgi:hypothetical protein
MGLEGGALRRGGSGTRPVNALLPLFGLTQAPKF